MSVFSQLALRPADPILGLNEAFKKDTRTQKVNLGVGVYYDEQGQLPLLNIIQKIEISRAQQGIPKGYLPIDGLAEYHQATQRYLLGKDSPLIKNQRAVTVQALGGTGALYLGGQLIKKLNPQPTIHISQPTWTNHINVFKTLGFQVKSYRYYHPTTGQFDFEGMKQDLEQIPAGDIVLLHACCHNPTGVDPSHSQWENIVNIIKQRHLLPFVDSAYQGFGDGLDEDAFVIRLIAQQEMPCLISASFSKSFGLYGERVGALTVLCDTSDEAQRVQSQLKGIIRTTYSNPPTHGVRLVTEVLNNPDYLTIWATELGNMRTRIQQMRTELAEGLNTQQNVIDFSFIKAQKGMFSFSGLSPEQMQKLQENFGIYGVSNGRICISALNEKNMDYIIRSIAHTVS
ncbi:MAG: aspartate/tyrosine/aromatic aminotransferase [Alcaligenaceae bacterium]|nr:aspartate/tyrosine/aromatic aminotransferase [Alcaligenaceae bacterium]